MTKKDLRIQYKQMRNALSQHEIADKSLAIANQALSLPIWDKMYFHVFIPIVEYNEIDTALLLHILSGKDKEIIVSKTDFTNRQMIHYLLTDNTRFIKNQYNIPEPTDGIMVPGDKIDVVFVPLLAFDKAGNRVGYGKGFYDKFLLECRSDVIKVGLSFFEAADAFDEVFESDIAMDYCVTPFRTYVF